MSRPRGRKGRAPGAAAAGPIALHAGEDGGPQIRTARATWAVIAAAGAVLAWIAFARHPVGDYYTESDFYGYVEGARLFQHGRIDFSRYSVIGPLYELVLAALSLVVRDEFRAGQLLSIASAAGVLLLWARIARRRAGEATALWTTLFIAVNPVFLRYGTSATTDMLAVFMESAAACAILATAGPRAPLLAGLLVALAVLTRYSAVILVPAALAYVLFWPEPGDPAAGRAGSGRLRAVGLFAAGFALLALPWWIVSLRAGHLPGANLVQSFSFYSDPSPDRNIQDAAPNTAVMPYRSLVDLLREQPRALLARLLANVPDHLRRNLKTLVGVPVAWVCGIGLLFALLDGAWRRLLPVALAGGLLFASLVPVFYSDRYALPLVPYYLLLAGLAVGSPRLALRVAPPGLSLKWVAALVPLALSVQSAVAQQRLIATQLPVEVVAAGAVLRRVAPPGSSVLSRKEHIGYYAGLAVVPFPRFDSLPELATYCRARDVRFIYYSWYEGQLRPEFAYLLDTTAAIPGLSLIYYSERNPSVVYRVGPGFGSNPAWYGNELLTRLHRSRALARVLPDSLAAPHWVLLGALALDQERPAEALDYAARASRARPRDPQGWVLAGEALRALGRLPEARRAYESALALDPGELESRLGLGWVELNLGDPDAAARTWGPVAGRTRDPATLGAMVRVFERQGNTEGARAARAAMSDTVR